MKKTTKIRASVLYVLSIAISLGLMGPMPVSMAQVEGENNENGISELLVYDTQTWDLH